MAVNSSRYAKNNHVVEYRGRGLPVSDADKEKMAALSVFVRSRGINFIVSDDFLLAQACEADGVLLSSVNGIGAAREALGEDAIIGVRCAASKDDAQAVLQSGADYIAFFDPLKGFVDPALIEWWTGKTDIPCLVEGNITNENCAFYVRAGAYFMDASRYVWEHKDGVMQGIVNMMHAIDVAAGRITDTRELIQ